MASIKVTVQDSNNITVTLGLPNQLTVTIDRGVVGPMGPPGAGITPQAVGFTASGGTVSKTLTVALDANVSGTNTGDQTGGTPAVVLGTANTPGTSTNFLRRDDTILTFDATAPSTQAFSDAAVVGVATVAARRDHKHAMMATPTTITGNAGTATALATPRAINGTNFDGTAAITVTAAGNTLTGTTLSTSITTASITALPTGLSIGSGTGTLAAGATTITGLTKSTTLEVTSTSTLAAVNASGTLSNTSGLITTSNGTDGAVRLGAGTETSITGGATYSGIYYDIPAARNHIFNVGGVNKATISSTGLAVTGTTSTTTGMAVGGATAGAGGIAFPATEVTGLGANVLGDYEKGTWTPTFTGAVIVGTPTYYGTYTKIGRLVRFGLYITSTTSWATHASNRAATYFTGPFAPDTTFYLGSGILSVVNAGTNAEYGQNTIAANNIFYMPIVPATNDIFISGEYQAAS